MRYLIMPFLYLLACVGLQEFFGLELGDRGFYLGLAAVMLLTTISDRRLNP